MESKIKKWELAAKILVLVLVMIVSFCALSKNVAGLPIYSESAESLEETTSTVMAISTSSLAVSFAITLLPDDYATPLADTLADLNTYLIFILGVVFFEKLLLSFGVPAVFRYVIPTVCILFIAHLLTKKDILKVLATKILMLAIALALVVPCGTALSNAVCSDSMQYVNETITEADKSADVLDDSSENGIQDKSFFDKVSRVFETAVNGVKELIEYYKNLVKKFINSVVILVVANCVIPIVTFVVFVWFLNQLFQFDSFKRKVVGYIETKKDDERVEVE